MASAAIAAAAVVVAIPLVLRSGVMAPDAPPASPSGSVSATDTAVGGLAGTQWMVDLAASGITARPDDSLSQHLAAVVLLDADGTLRLANGYAGAGPLWAGTWAGAGSAAPGSRGTLRFDTGATLDAWDLNPRCRQFDCPEGDLPYWPGVVAFERLRDAAAYELQAVDGTEMVPVATTGMTLLDTQGHVVLCLVRIDQLLEGAEPQSS